MDNINMIKSAKDIKKQTSIQNLIQAKASYTQVLGQIGKEMEEFSTSLNPNHLYQAIFLQGEISSNSDLKKAGFNAPAIDIHTVDTFKKAFTFPQIALNEYAQDQLVTLKEKEEMLNKDLNLGNKGGLDSFVELAKLTSLNLKKKYGDQWVNPNQEIKEEIAAVAETPVAESSTKKEDEAILPSSTATESKQKSP
jgi:hypothetical protein